MRLLFSFIWLLFGYDVFIDSSFFQFFKDINHSQETIHNTAWIGAFSGWLLTLICLIVHWRTQENKKYTDLIGITIIATLISIFTAPVGGFLGVTLLRLFEIGHLWIPIIYSFVFLFIFEYMSPQKIKSYSIEKDHVGETFTVGFIMFTICYVAFKIGMLFAP